MFGRECISLNACVKNNSCYWNMWFIVFDACLENHAHFGMHMAKYMLEKNASCWMLVVGCLFERECILLNACVEKNTYFRMHAWKSIYNVELCDSYFWNACYGMHEKSIDFRMHILECILLKRMHILGCIISNSYNREWIFLNA